MSNNILAADFSIKKADKKNFKHSIILRSNLTNEFTIGEMESDLVKLENLEKELSSQVRLSKAALDNISRNHAFVSKLSDEQLRTAAYVYETKRVLDASEKKLKDVKKQQKKYREVKDVIYKKFGFKDEKSN